MSLRTETFTVALLGALALFQACRQEAGREKPVVPAAAQSWSEPRTLTAAEASSPAGTLRLEVRHEPVGAVAARMRLVLVGPRGEGELWSSEIDLAARDRLWAAKWALALEPAPGGRLAVSTDGGARWRPGYPAADGWLLCPHLQAEGKAGAPDW